MRLLRRSIPRIPQTVATSARADTAAARIASRPETPMRLRAAAAKRSVVVLSRSAPTAVSGDHHLFVPV